MLLHVGLHRPVEPQRSLRKHDILWMMSVGSDWSGLKSCGGRLVRTDHLAYYRLKRDIQHF